MFEQGLVMLVVEQVLVRACGCLLGAAFLYQWRRRDEGTFWRLPSRGGNCGQNQLACVVFVCQNQLAGSILVYCGECASFDRQEMGMHVWYWDVLHFEM